MFLLGWTGDNGDPDNFIYTLLDKDSIGGNNYTFFENDKMHDILIEAQTDTDQKKRNELYKKRRKSFMTKRLGFHWCIRFQCLPLLMI